MFCKKIIKVVVNLVVSSTIEDKRYNKREMSIFMYKKEGDRSYKKEPELKEYYVHPILRTFLENSGNYQLLTDALKKPSLQTKELVDQAFKEFYSEMRLVKYISSLIHYSSIDFDRKQRKIRSKAQLILDQPLSEDKENTAIKDLIPAENSEPSSLLEEDCNTLEDLATTSALYNSIRSLTEKERSVLTWHFIHGLTDTEIARKTGVSQQAVTKTKRNALKKLKRQLQAM